MRDVTSGQSIKGTIRYMILAVLSFLNLDKFKDIQSDIELSGTPVCEGIVSGIARVAKTLEEASLTQPGEILITRYTDIGWSPIFPIINGLVTEIGGLLSHGSVVAREYGLPCIIAVADATDIFHTV
uniref:PEP-utilising enzyme mobile domain-containing protein n=1 Tax=Panagrolaimus superbus TaxID=310955 RepID=A0A914ZBL9_9BILA